MTVIKVENLSKQYQTDFESYIISINLGNKWAPEFNARFFDYKRGLINGLNFDALRKWMKRSVGDSRNKTLFERSEFVLLSETQYIFSNRNFSLDFFGYFLGQAKK